MTQATCPLGHTLRPLGCECPTDSWICDAHDEDGCLSAPPGEGACYGTGRFSCEECDYDLCCACAGARTGKVRRGPCGGANLLDVISAAKEGADLLVDPETVKRVLIALSAKEEEAEPDDDVVVVSDGEESESESAESSSVESTDSVTDLRRSIKRRRLLVDDARRALEVLDILQQAAEGPTAEDRMEVARIAREALQV